MWGSFYVVIPPPPPLPLLLTDSLQSHLTRSYLSRSHSHALLVAPLVRVVAGRRVCARSHRWVAVVREARCHCDLQSRCAFRARWGCYCDVQSKCRVRVMSRCPVLPCHIMSCRSMSCCVTSCHAVSRRESSHVVSRRVPPCCVASGRVDTTQIRAAHPHTAHTHTT